jgi:hypothetical protein
MQRSGPNNRSASAAVAAGPASVNRAALLAAVGNRGFDLAVLAALRAVGASPRPSLVLLAYTAAEVLALVPANLVVSGSSKRGSSER